MNYLSFLFGNIAYAAETSTNSNQGIGALGLNGWSILFQIINFALLLWLLQRFAFKPILKMLADRRATIEASLKTAAELAEAKAAMAKKEQAILAAARTQAEHIIIQAHRQAEEQAAAIAAKAQEHAAQIKQQAEVEINQSLAAARRQLKQEAVHLVTAATEQIIKVKLDPAQDAKLISEALQAAEESIPNSK
jgi:F-type H+-transporting ATPase subunit b